jgi:WD40 repeat protein
MATGQLVRDFKDLHSDAVLALAFSPDGKLLASGAADRMAKILDIKSGKVIRSLEGHTGHVFGVAWKADGRTLATCSADRQVKFWDTTTGDRRANVGSFGKDVMSVGFIGTSDLLAAASGDGVVKLVNEAGNVSKTTSAKTAFLQSGAVTPDGKLIAVGGEAGAVTIWRELEGTGETLVAPGQ